MSYKKDMSKYEHLEGWERCGFGEQLDKWAEKYGERTAVTDSEDEISYMELKQKADCLAAAFLRKGILKGDKVLVQLPNRISFVIVFFALSKIGAVPIMMLPAHREAELEGIIELAKPAAYIVVEKYLGFSYVSMANAMKEKYSCIRHIFVDSESGDISGMIAETCGENGAFPAVDGYETAVLLLSGGTTGVPKLIPRTHTDYMYNARMSAKRCRLDSSDVYLASLPVAHNFPLCCPGLLGTLDVGGKVVLASATSPDDILDAITEEGVTITALVPAMVTVCMEMLEWDEDYDISSLRILQVGGAMLEDSLADKIIEEWPCKLMQVFGTAEGLLSFTSPEDEGSLIARCQGTPVSPADEVKIVDEEDKAVPEGVFGELLSRGPYTIDGYYMAEEANKKSFTPDGFYRTGDKAMWTKDRRLRLSHKSLKHNHSKQKAESHIVICDLRLHSILYYTILTLKSAPLSGSSFPCFSWMILLLISKRSWIDGFFSFPVIAFLSAFPASLTAIFASPPVLGTASLLSFFSTTCCSRLSFTPFSSRLQKLCRYGST